MKEVCGISTGISTGVRKRYPQDGLTEGAGRGENLKYFLLDGVKNGCRMSTQSRLLTGIMTGSGRGERSGDAPIREWKSTETEAIYALDRSRKALLAERPQGSSRPPG